MRERNREINRRRRRHAKRKKLRVHLAAATGETEQRAIQEKIRKTFPRYTPSV